MTELSGTVSRRAARAILIDDDDRLVLIKRTKPGMEPYWTAPGGSVEDEDASAEAAMRRELAEELGAKAGPATQVFFFSSPDGDRVAVQYFFATRLLQLDESARTGTEFDDPPRGRYELDRVALHGDELASVDLKPTALRDFVWSNRAGLLADVVD